MYCRFCGQELPDDSAFCSKCGKAVQHDSKCGKAVQHEGAEAAPVKTEPVKPPAPPKPAVEHCRMELVEMDSPWSLFGNTRNRFEVINDKGEVIYQSDKFKVSGFSYDGPEEVSKKYRDLVLKEK